MRVRLWVLTFVRMTEWGSVAIELGNQKNRSVQNPFTSRKPFPTPRINPATPPKSRQVMKTLVPVLCALIPFAAMIGACVTCP